VITQNIASILFCLFEIAAYNFMAIIVIPLILVVEILILSVWQVFFNHPGLFTIFKSTFSKLVEGSW
jgi:hypothetical protein